MNIAHYRPSAVAVVATTLAWTACIAGKANSPGGFGVPNEVDRTYLAVGIVNSETAGWIAERREYGEDVNCFGCTGVELEGGISSKLCRAYNGECCGLAIPTATTEWLACERRDAHQCAPSTSVKISNGVSCATLATVPGFGPCVIPGGQFRFPYRWGAGAAGVSGFGCDKDLVDCGWGGDLSLYRDDVVLVDKFQIARNQKYLVVYLPHLQVRGWVLADHIDFGLGDDNPASIVKAAQQKYFANEKQQVNQIKRARAKAAADEASRAQLAPTTEMPAKIKAKVEMVHKLIADKKAEKAAELKRAREVEQSQHDSTILAVGAIVIAAVVYLITSSLGSRKSTREHQA